jgi:hypothetical protein
MESSANRAPSEPRTTQHGLIGLGSSMAKEDQSESLRTQVEQTLQEARFARAIACGIAHRF